MSEILTENEKSVLDFYKEEYNKKHSNSLGYMQPKLTIQKDILVSLQNKGYLEVKRSDCGDNTDFTNVVLKDKFFEYFRINR